MAGIGGKRSWRCLSALALLLMPTLAFGDDATLRWRTGGGNLVTHLTGPPSATLYQALEGVGARLGRMNSYGWRDLQRNPIPTNFDAAMLEAHRHGIWPIMLLEYEGSYQTLDPPQPIGSYDDWFKAGKAMAERFRPGGDWARENGIDDGYGVTTYTAVNEPDVQNTIPKQAYHDAMEGLADGVHSVDPSLKVVPAGFAACNIDGDATLRGYGPAIADLFENGKLDGIDLHTYYNYQFYPLTAGRQFSAQNCFDKIKTTLGITRDINFYATEFNVTREGEWENRSLIASLFLTAAWDNFGVVGNNDRPAMVLAFPWSLLDTGRFEGPGYAMAARENPWLPEVRAKVLQRILDIAGDMRFVSADPRHTGMFHLSGEKGDLYVWQNREGWTDAPGHSWTLTLPDWAKRVELWGYDGLRKVEDCSGGPYTFDNLKGGETLMVRVLR
ncbi:hypothetical protein [Rhizobium sp. PAMB 3182]